MSDRQPESGHSARLLRGLIWGGVGLAPIAALVVLIGGDGPARIAVLLVTVSVVLLGASLLIRNDPVLLRMEIEDGVAEQISALREEMREEIAAAAARVPTPMPSLPPMPSVPQKPAGGRAPGSTTGGRAVAAATAVPGQRGQVSGAVRRPGPPPPPQQQGPPHQAPSHQGPPHQGPPQPVRPPLVQPPPGKPPVAKPQPGNQTGSVVRSSASVRGPMAPVFRAAPAPMSAEPYGPHQASADSYGPNQASADYGPHQASAEPYGPHQAPAEGVYGRPRPGPRAIEPDHQPGGDQSGRRRADVTATDIGYTGRRSKGSHAATDDVVGPEIYEDPGYDENQGYDYVDGHYPQQNYDEDSGDVQSPYGYRDPAYRVNPYETGSFGEPDPGYPGWSDVDEPQAEERVPRGGRRR